MTAHRKSKPVFRKLAPFSLGINFILNTYNCLKIRLHYVHYEHSYIDIYNISDRMIQYV